MLRRNRLAGPAVIEPLKVAMLSLYLAMLQRNIMD